MKKDILKMIYYYLNVEINYYIGIIFLINIWSYLKLKNKVFILFNLIYFVVY